MNADLSVERLGVSAYRKWFWIAVISSALSGRGLVMSISRPDSHPLVLAFSVSWIIVLAVASLTRDACLRMDPKRFHFLRWEREGLAYGRAGVVAFRWLLLHSPLSWLNPLLKFKARRCELERLSREVNVAEVTHFAGAVLTLVAALGYAVFGHVMVGIWFAVLIVPMHGYPWMLQRWNRGRICRLMRRMHAPGRSAPHDAFDLAGRPSVQACSMPEPAAPPNGGRAGPFGDSALGRRPPSVS